MLALPRRSSRWQMLCPFSNRIPAELIVNQAYASRAVPYACSYKPSCSPSHHPIAMTIHLSFLFLLALFAINAVECVNATPLSETASIHTTRFTSTKNPKVSIRFVTNSGVCESTPGVQQISGYLDVGKNMSMVNISFKVNIFNQIQSLISVSVVLVLWVSNFSGIGSFHTLVCPIVFCRDSDYDIC